MSRKLRDASLIVAVGLLVATAAAYARAKDPSTDPQNRFTHGVEAIERGSYDEAIDAFEALADRGFVHADSSYNRAVAYAGRATTPQAKTGDLGQAAAALTETLLLRPDDEQAESALARVRSEIARARARRGGEPVIVRPSLDRALVRVADEGTWWAGAGAGSFLLTVGLAVRELLQKATARLAGGVCACLGATLLVGFLSLALGARHLRLTTRPAVVVVDEARILDGTGAAMKQVDGVPEFTAIPEGAEVEAHERQDHLAKVRWGNIDGWVIASQLRYLSRPEVHDRD